DAEEEGNEGEVQRKGPPGGEELEGLSEHAESTERVDAAHDYQAHIEERKPANPTSSRQGIDTKEEVKCAKKRRNESVPSEQSAERRCEWDINKSDDDVKESNGETQEGSPEEPRPTGGSHITSPRYLRGRDVFHSTTTAL